MSMKSLGCGFSIVEMLIAMLVLSIGLLGIAGLFVNAFADSRSALYRAQAVHLVKDMAERIRTNQHAENAYSLAQGDAPLMQGCVAAGIDCTPLALAQDDLSRWLVAVHDTLPGDGHSTPSGTVSVDAAASPLRYTVTVTWSEPGATAPSTFALDLQI